MNTKRIVSLVCGVSVLTVIAGEDVKEKKNPTIQRLFAIEERSRWLGSPAMREIESQTNLFTDLCQYWATADSPKQEVEVLDFLYALGMRRSELKRSRYKLADDNLANALVDALDDDDSDVREKASWMLVNHVDEKTLRKVGRKIVDMARQRIEEKRPTHTWIMVLGRTGMTEAKTIIESNFQPEFDAEARLALAKLGNEEYERRYIDQFKTNSNMSRKIGAALALSYIGSNAAGKALAEELRSPEKGDRGAPYSFRIDIIEALSGIFPDEPVLMRPGYPGPQDDSYYDKIEKWAEKKFDIKWDKPRPPFFYVGRGGGRPSSN